MAYETHYDRYEELKSKYKIAHGFAELLSKEERKDYGPFDRERIARTRLNEYDVVIVRKGSVYAGAKYEVIRNASNLSYRDLAIICDKGNLCFGYRIEGGCIVVYTD